MSVYTRSQHSVHFETAMVPEIFPSKQALEFSPMKTKLHISHARSLAFQSLFGLPLGESQR